MQFSLSAAKRFLIGKPVASHRLGQTLLPKRLALPVFSSDALSSVAYAPDEIFLTLSLAGLAGLALSPWVALAVVVVLGVVIASYRNTIHAYPSGGGDYAVVAHNLGKNAGLTAASALTIDYILTVAVSISAGANYLVSLIPALHGAQTYLAIGVVVVIALLNMRGVRESSRTVAIPVYLYMFALGLLSVVGAVRYFIGNLGMAASAELTINPEIATEQGMVGAAGLVLLVRAFSSGCVTLTGIEAITNGVPIFRRPKARNASITLVIMGLLSATMLASIMALGKATGVRVAAHPASQLFRDGIPVGDGYYQAPVIGQIAATVFDGFWPLFALVTVTTGMILLLAANTAFNGFPVLASILAKDAFLPRQLYTRGDRLAFSNGIMALATAAIILIVVFDAHVTGLIPLYLVGVFISFTMSQTGMVRHFTRELGLSTDADERVRMRRARVLSAIGAVLTASVLILVLVTKFRDGAWITPVLMGGVFFIMYRINRHYTRVAASLQLPEHADVRLLPSRVHAVIPVASIDRPALRALAYARATRPYTLAALHVCIDPQRATKLQRLWQEKQLPVDLTLLDSPYREITKPLLDHIRSIRERHPRDLVVVFIPEYVEDSWWKNSLHNQMALRLKSRLLFVSGVVVSSVPYHVDTPPGGTQSSQPSGKPSPTESNDD
ncbi:MAG: APC family permease [Bowdeniella nasicola]|nr:APC family permease [Bowdeniella nasicola]